MVLTRRGVPALAVLTTAAITLAACGGGSDGAGDPQRNADAKKVTLTIAANAIKGGKNTEQAEWITEWVIPHFEKKMKAEGVDANVTFQPSGVDDEKYKTKLALDLKSDSGPDLFAVDGIWVGEFAQAGYIQSLNEVVGEQFSQWDGWQRIPDAVSENAAFGGQRYGVPEGTDGRVFFYNKQLFQQAGLPADWQPTSWEDVLAAGRALSKLDGVTPIQLDAGTAMGEATTMQGVLPLLVGTGERLYQNGKWQGDTESVRKVLGLYDEIYSSGLGDKRLQQSASGRDESFQKFAEGEIGILLESDYFWRDVINPATGVAPMGNREEVVGWARIPAVSPGQGIRGQDFVSMSGGGSWVLNPNTKYPQQAWELLSFMFSAKSLEAATEKQPFITARSDVNEKILAGDPMLSYVNEEVLPITAYRPGLAVYPQVSLALQEATADIVAGQSVEQAAKTYQQEMEQIVGADNVISSG